MANFHGRDLSASVDVELCGFFSNIIGGSGGKYFVYLSINSKNYFMALEEVTTEVEVEDPKKKKKKLASMKKEPTMDTELRENVPVSKVLREAKEFSNIMAENERKTKLELAANDRLRAMKINKGINNIGKGLAEAGKNMGEKFIGGLSKVGEVAGKIAGKVAVESRFSKPSNNDNIGHKYKNLEGGKMKVILNKKKLM